MNTRYLEGTLWHQWIGVSFINTTIIGVLSPFLGWNLAVILLGWERGNQFAELFMVFSVIGCGLLVGLIESMILKRFLPQTNWWVLISTISGFMIGTVLGAISYPLTIGGFYVVFIPLCLVGVLCWGLGIMVPILVPRTWRL